MIKNNGANLLGIIFTGGEGPPSKLIKQLLEEANSPLLIAADSGLLAAENAGLLPDWVIGDMDSLNDISRLAALPPERVIRTPRDKDYTDTELAFSHAVKQGCDEIWIIGGGGGRIDHLFGIRSLFERDIFPIRWVTDNADIRCIEAKSEICCCLEKGAIVSVFPLGAGPWRAASSGLKWPLNGVSWDRGFFGLSNIAVNGEFSIVAETGRFMIILPYV
jgi:thiamine pyrophosphokinase